MKYAIGLDLGGTHIKGGLIDETGRILEKETRPTPSDARSAEPVVQALIRFGSDLRQRAAALGLEIAGVGFGQPNIIEGPDWIQRQVNNLPALEGAALRPALAAAFGPRIAMDNDVMNAAYAEYHFGAGHLYGRVFFISLGTGIASGIFTEDRRQLRYVAGWTGDTGHIIIDPHGLPCTCGGRGCLETVATGPAIRRQALAATQAGKSPKLAEILALESDLSPQSVTQAALAGDSAAQQIWEEVGLYLGMALTSYVHIFNPHVILVGGGLAEAGDLLLGPVRRTVATLGSPYYLAHLQAIQPASLGSDAGLIGAAALILRPQDQPA